jgi:hypothetical protein
MQSEQLADVVCETCGNNSCSTCGQLFQRKPLHICWHEDVCDECQGPPLSEAELDYIFRSER